MRFARIFTLVFLVLSVGFALTSCDFFYGLIGGDPLETKVRLDVVVEYGPQAMLAGTLKVGIIDTAIPENGEISAYISDFYGVEFLNVSQYDGTSDTSNVVFRDVPESSIMVFALIDLDNDGYYDAGEPYGTATASLSGDSTVSIHAGADLSTYELSGTIDIGYGFSQGGNLRVLLYDRLPDASTTPYETLDLAYNGAATTMSYSFDALLAGVYHLETFLDLDSDDVYDEGEEPFAKFENASGNPITISIDSDVVRDLLLETVQTGYNLTALLSFDGAAVAGQIIARIYTSTDTTTSAEAELFQDFLGGANAITMMFENVAGGDYYLFAFVDEDGNEAYDAGEVSGEYPNDGALYNLYSDYDTGSIIMAP